MKKRLIAALAGTLFVTTSLLPAISAKAEPTSVEQARTQYEELKNDNAIKCKCKKGVE